MGNFSSAVEECSENSLDSDKMADCPDYYTNISLLLSRVMNDVGVNKECVIKRRRMNLMVENIITFITVMLNEKRVHYIFGSQTEGTTTLDLSSDTDILSSSEDSNVIQDWKDWKHGKINLLMLRDERLYPGYCKLQLLYKGVPLPVSRDDCPDDGRLCVDSDGHVIFKDHYIEEFNPGSKRHGPAATSTLSKVELDYVGAFRCETWPLHYKQWAQTNKRRDWPTPEMIQHMESTGCFVVKAAHRLDVRNETWRISTSLAERCLMFSLNITQIRCYVLVKMVVRTFIQPHLPTTISSYMCKTLMFHAIENTKQEIWKEHNLLRCVHLVLLYMLAAVLDENCPNYFNESANLFLGKVDRRNKKKLVSILRMLLKSGGRFVLFVSLENINRKLATYVSEINHVVPQADVKILQLNCEQMMNFFPISLSIIQIVIKVCYNEDRTNEVIAKIGRFVEKGQLQKQAARIYLPFLCSFLATTDASKSLTQKAQIKPSTLKLFDLSLHSDVTSSRLKFASYLYCTGQLERTLSVLQDVEERMNDSVMMVCGCHNVKYPPRFLEREASQKYPTTDRIALCVMFSKAEIQCCPRELLYEQLRSTQEDKRNRDYLDNFWMDLVVIDSLPYLYYLQYMTFRHLGQHDQQYTALNKLRDCVRNNDLTHRETAYNVLGQCMEYEGWLDDAFECYRRSLRIRPNNNAVRWQIMRRIGRVRWGRV